MKTLHLSLILFGTILVTIGGSGTSFGGGPLLQIDPTKDSFADGEIISMSGHAPNSKVNIFLVNNYGNIENSTSVTSSNTGDFNASLGIPLHAKGGSWAIFAKSGENNFARQVMINFHGVNTPPFNFPSGLAPLKQFKVGIEPTYIQCRSDLLLIVKSENNSPACVTSHTANKLVQGGWGIMTISTSKQVSIVPNTNACGQFSTAPTGNDHNTVPILLLNSNSTACARLTFTIFSNYKDCNWKICPSVIVFDPLHIGNLHYEKHDNMFSVSAGKDYTNSFNITTLPGKIDLANYPIGANFTVTYVIKPLPNATGFYDQSIPKLACERYPLAVGYAANQVNASNFSYIDPLNPPCGAWVYRLTGVEISGMNYKQVALLP